MISPFKIWDSSDFGNCGRSTSVLPSDFSCWIILCNAHEYTSHLFNVIISVSVHNDSVADKTLLPFVVITIKSPLPVKRRLKIQVILHCFCFSPFLMLLITSAIGDTTQHKGKTGLAELSYCGRSVQTLLHNDDSHTALSEAAARMTALGNLMSMTHASETKMTIARRQLCCLFSLYKLCYLLFYCFKMNWVA